MAKRVDYRKFYAQYYGIKVPEDFDIHHNLIAIRAIKRYNKFRV